MTIETPAFSICECDQKYTIERHGESYALYFGRCSHLHGYNIAKISETTKDFIPEHIEKLLNQD